MRLTLAMGAPEDKLVPHHIRAFLHILGYVFLLSSREHRCHGYTDTTSNDTSILLSFKANADRGGALSSWNTSNCCSGNGSSSGWVGVACQGGRVSRLALRGLRLAGPIGALVSLTELRVLVLSDNLLDGSLPNLTNWKALWLLNLSQNRLSGPIPPSISSLSRLWRLDLSYNSLSGSIPTSLNSLPRLLTLHLQSNDFTGSIPLLNIPSLIDLSLQNNQISGHIPLLQLGNLTTFDASYNNLSGQIPVSLSKFPASSFAGNVNLCGEPLTACNESQDILSNPASPMVVPSNPSSGPGHMTPALSSSTKKPSNRLSLGAIIAIVIGDVILLLVLTLLFLLCYWKKMVYESEDEDEKWKKGGDGEMEKGHTNSMIGGVQGPDGEKGMLVFVSGEKRFGLDDLLKASAEMLGKGSFGTAYKAVLEDGCAVVVKRLKEVSTTGKREFEQHMELIGRLSHPHIVPLRAYYYAKQEKLLVYDYMAGGSLYNLLHGNRGLGRVPLDWGTRLDIALGAAKGLAHIHGNGPQQQQEQQEQQQEEEKGVKGRGGMVSHGNLKSSNVLVDARGNACIADCGLADLVNPSVIAARLVGYRAPESHAGKGGATSSAATSAPSPPASASPPTWQRAQRCDVYSFGVVLLELLTGRAPSQCLQDDGLDLATWVQSVVREEWTAEVFDLELMRSRKHDREEEEMVGLLQVAMACTSRDPAHRPPMPHVVRMIEDIRAPSDRSPAAATAASHYDEGTSPSHSPSITSEEAATTTPSTIP